MRIFLVVFLMVASLFAETIDCTKVFEERKSELLKEIEKIDEARQSFEALKAATNALFEKQQASIDEQRSDLNKTMQQISAKEASIKKMLEDNKKLLAQIKGAKNDKISETYSKMKDSAAANILATLPVNEAAAVLFSLDAKKMSKVMAKMNPQIASQITEVLRKGPPFLKEEKK